MYIYDGFTLQHPYGQCFRGARCVANRNAKKGVLQPHSRSVCTQCVVIQIERDKHMAATHGQSGGVPEESNDRL